MENAILYYLSLLLPLDSNMTTWFLRIINIINFQKFDLTVNNQDHIVSININLILLSLPQKITKKEKTEEVWDCQVQHCLLRRYAKSKEVDCPSCYSWSWITTMSFFSFFMLFWETLGSLFFYDFIYSYTLFFVFSFIFLLPTFGSHYHIGCILLLARNDCFFLFARFLLNHIQKNEFCVYVNSHVFPVFLNFLFVNVICFL